MSVEELAQINQGYLLYWLDPGQKTLVEQGEWTTLPSVENGQAIELSAAWSYGGAMSVMTIADAILEALSASGEHPQ